MKLLVAGISHKTAPVHLREKLAIPEHAIPDALRALQQSGAAEALVLSTCNRVEIAATVPDHEDPARVVSRFLALESAPEGAGADPYVYRLEHREAIRHLFRVAASLDSMVVGEPQILGQIKAAYALAKTEGSVGGLLENVLTRAFSVAKRVRSETGIGQMAVSVSYAAVELARTIFGSLRGHSVMIIGSGKMGELAAKHLRRSGANRIFVANRTRSRAEEIAQLFGGRVVEYTSFLQTLPEIDIVIASSGAPHYILTREDMQQVISARRNKPMFLIDIAVPRNVEPSVNEIEGVFLYDVDDLEGVVSANIKEREHQARQAEAIVEEEVDRMIARLKIEEVTPTIVGLQEQFEEIRAAEVMRALRRLPSLTPEQREQVEAQIQALSKSIVNKIAHAPISELRNNAGHPEGTHVIDAIRKVFHLHR
jgi:glutamyl-tRNA reductase